MRIGTFGMHALLSSLAMATLTMPPEVILNEAPSSSSGKLKRGLGFKRIHSGDKPYNKPAELGRNEPCHCGSGKKYKKCCMNEVVVTPNEIKA